MINSNIFALKNSEGKYFTGKTRNFWSTDIGAAKLYRRESSMKDAARNIEKDFNTTIQPTRICIREIGKFSTYN